MTPEAMAWTVLLVAVGLSFLPTATTSGDELAALDAIVERGMAEQRYPGAVLLVGRHGNVRYARAFGRHTYEPSSPPMRMNTVFDMASCTKVAAGTPAALLLAEDGKLDLDKPVGAYWPEFAAHGKQDVTLRDLLTHVSGLKAYENYTVVENARQPGETHAEALYRHYAALPLTYKPRSKVLYSCLNLQCAGYVVQRVAGESLEDFLRKRLWRPLGMRDTTFRPPTSMLERCAPTAVSDDGQPVRGKVHDPLAAYHGTESVCPANAGLFSTAGDLARYVQMLLGRGRWRGRQILSPASVALMTSVQTPARVKTLRSIGWAVYGDSPFVGPIQKDATQRTVGHTGYTGTWIWLDPSTRSYIIFLTNRVFPSPATNGNEGPSIDGVRADIARVVVQALAADSQASGSSPSAK